MSTTENKSDGKKPNIRRKTIIAFAVFGLMWAIGIYGWFWVKNQPVDHGLLGGVQIPLRKVLDGNEKIFSKVYNPKKVAKIYPFSEAVKKPRVNGKLGMDDDFDPELWKLQVIKANGDTLLISMEEIKKLKKTEITFDFKCIEGWSQVTNWGGVKFSDFIEKYGLDAESKLGYVGLVTPDEDYYVGIDMPSAMNDQTLLCYEMNRKPLPLNQGFPLRLIIPVKYGIKSLKRIGEMNFSNERPKDYWFEKGYDYYSGM